MLDPANTIAGKSYAYVPNPYYYDKSRIYWDKVVIGVFEDQNSAIQAMKTGQLKLLVAIRSPATPTRASSRPTCGSSPIPCNGLASS